VVGVHRLHVALLRVSAAHQTGRRRPVAVDHVQIGKRRDPAVQRNAVLTVEEIRQRRHGNLSIVVGLVAARRVDDVHLVAAVFEPIPPRADRVRYPVDTGEVTVGEESDVHARACRRRVVCFAPPEHSPGSGCCADPPRTVSATATVPATTVAPPSRSDRPQRRCRVQAVPRLSSRGFPSDVHQHFHSELHSSRASVGGHGPQLIIRRANSRA